MASKAAEEQRLDPEVPGNSVVPLPGKVISGPLVDPGAAVGLVSLLPYSACISIDIHLLLYGFETLKLFQKW